METQAGREHLYLGSDNKWYKLTQDQKTGKYTVKSGMEAYTAGSQKLQDLKKKYDELPGFAEGIAEAVAKGISGIGTTIANAIAGALKFPDMSPMTKALEDLVKPLVDFTTWMTNHANPEGVAAEKSSEERLTAAGIQSKPDAFVGHYEWIDPSAHSPDEDPEAAASKALGHASGVTFTKTGIYTGKFHGPEETLPRATTIKGPGIIARALEALDMGAKSSRPSESSSSKTEIHIHNTNDFSGLKVSNDYDLEKLFRQIDKRIESVSVEAVKKQLGQRRN
jgi:hypothetical protein